MRRNKRNEQIDLLAEQQLFCGFDARALARIDGLVTRVEVRGGTRLVTEGGRGQEMFIVIDGEAEVSSEGRVLGHIGAGGFFGEMAMLDRGPRSATVTAVDDMDVLVVGQDGFNSLVDEPVVLRRMLAAESGRLRRANISASD